MSEDGDGKVADLDAFRADRGEARVGQVGRVRPFLDDGLLVVEFSDGGRAGFWPEEVRRV